MSGPVLNRFARGFVAASSGRDAWLFRAAAGQRHALHWDGRKWSKRAIPSWAVRGNLSGSVALVPVDFGPRNLWLFSLGIDSIKPTTPFAARYHNGRWTKVTLPRIPGAVSAVGPDDIWALSFSPRVHSNAFLMHWNGRSWHTLAVPAPTKVPANSIEYVGGLMASGPANVWLEQDIQTGSQGARTLYLMHWDGKRWSRVHFHFTTSFAHFIAQDGHGGIWVVANGPAPHYLWYLDHLNGGHWSRQPAPATATTKFQQITALTWIPGTRSLWAAGGLLPLHSTTAVLGALFRYKT